MFMANLAATAVGAGLLYAIYEFVLRGYRTDQYVEFHIRTSNYLGAIFALFFALIVIYEWPIRRYLDRIGSNASIPASLQAIVEKRLLNEPYFIIGIDMAAWIIGGVTFAIFERHFGLPWQEISMNRFDALLTGLVSTTLAFFLLERILQSYLVPYVFPRGKLYSVNGTRRINLAVRLYEIIRRHAAKKAEEIIEAVITAVNQFQDESGAEDDITLIVIKKEGIYGP